MVKKIIAIIQARMSSSRLPGKVMLHIENKPMLYHVINQTKASKLINDVIVATSISLEDDVISDYCKRNKIKCFRGSLTDVLDRYYKCATKFKCDPIVRITADCPLIDPIVIDKAIIKFLKNSYDYVANNLEKVDGKWENATCNFPQGMTIEISTYKALENAYKYAKKPSEREHVFPYIQFNPELFHVSNFKMKKDLSRIRCTVDKKEDLEFIQEIFKRLPHKKVIHIKDIVKLIHNEPKLLNINKNTDFDEGYKKSLLVDKKHGFK